MAETTTESVAHLIGLGESLHTGFPEMVALYLFGSRAEGRARPDSDFDLAVLTAPHLSCTPQHVFAYYAPLSALLHTDRIDLVWLNQAPWSLQWQVVHTGKLLFCRDATIVAEFIEQITSIARDHAYYARLSRAWYSAFLRQTYLRHGTHTMLDHQRLIQKIDYIRNTCRPALRQLATLPIDRFSTDPIALGAARYYVQTAIEAMLDMVNHIMSRRGLGTFDTHAKTFERLSEHGIVRREHLDTYLQMIGLRNRLVHLYEGIAPAILHGIATQELDDFDLFIADVTRLLIAEEGAGN